MTVLALRERRIGTLADLLEAHGREIQGVAYLILRDRSLAEDVAIETLLTAFERVEGGGPVMIALECAGTGPIEVSVDIGARVGRRLETFTAECSPEGAITAQSFVAASSYLDVTYSAPAGSWTAMTILVPDPLPAH